MNSGVQIFANCDARPILFALYSVSRQVGIGNNGLDPPDKIVRSLRDILKYGINITRLTVFTHREISLSEVFVMPTIRHTTRFMLSLGFVQQKRAESFGGSWQGAARLGLSSRLPKAYENGNLNPSIKCGGVTLVFPMLCPFSEFLESCYRSIIKSISNPVSHKIDAIYILMLPLSRE